jgi:heme/copper-type cytochrome/quinol oxidase subunit 2
MDLVSIFSSIVLVTTIATLVVAIAAYFAYKVREWRKPKTFSRGRISDNAPFEPIFLHRHILDNLDKTTDAHADITANEHVVNF